MRPSAELGQYGEDLAAEHLTAAGMTLLARNWRCRDGEIDLVLRRGRSLVICEVKTRSTDAFGVPAEAVTHAKRAKLRVLASRWLDQASFRPKEIRFDVAAILAGELEIIEAAF